jgi:hypothetical protein
MVTLRNLTICFVVIFFSHATPSLCRELHFDSTDRYNIRWGKQDGDADLVKCRHGLTVGYSFGPACFKKGSYIIVSLVLDDTPEDKVVVDWYHVENGLYRAIGVDSNGNPVTEETAFMSLPVQEQGQGVGKVFIMGPLPDWIEWCVLKVRVIFVHQGKQGRVGVSALHWCEIFTVLDEPKAPMNPAWVSVLRISCQWARGESTVEGAARKLTKELHKQGKYNDGTSTFVEVPYPDLGETFYLKKFLEHPNFPWGQCQDFADFLVCLFTSVGIEAFSQRTHLLPPSRHRVTLPDGREGRLLGFGTYPLDTAPSGQSDYDGIKQWSFHQFSLFNNKVWDSMIAFLPQDWKSGDPYPEPLPDPVLGMTREPDYRDKLVWYYLVWYDRNKNGRIDNCEIIMISAKTAHKWAADQYWAPPRYFKPKVTAETPFHIPTIPTLGLRPIACESIP